MTIPHIINWFLVWDQLGLGASACTAKKVEDARGAWHFEQRSCNLYSTSSYCSYFLSSQLAPLYCSLWHCVSRAWPYRAIFVIGVKYSNRFSLDFHMSERRILLYNVPDLSLKVETSAIHWFHMSEAADSTRPVVKPVLVPHIAIVEISEENAHKHQAS